MGRYMAACRMRGPSLTKGTSALAETNGKERRPMKKALKQMLAVDLGASSGRVMLGGFDGEKISVEEQIGRAHV